MIKAVIVTILVFSSALFAKDLQVETLVQRTEVIWGFDFLPEGKIIFTAREGKILLYDPREKKVEEVSGAPKVLAEEQAGLLDIRVHPDFKKNKTIYLTYSEPIEKLSATAVATAQLDGLKLTNFKKIFSAEPPQEAPAHYGSRIEFDGKGHIFVSLGERYKNRDFAQKLDNHLGKILRLNEDGSAAEGNPFSKNPNAKKEIWSYGHRNPQGLAFDSKNGVLWEAEFGPKGGDEVNIINPGLNYGWPVITYGAEYDGPKIGTTSKKGMEQPIVYYVPSISPSAIAYSNGKLFLACLSGQQLRQLTLKNNKVVKQDVLLTRSRFRNVRVAPNGFLYFSTDEGKIGRFKIEP